MKKLIALIFASALCAFAQQDARGTIAGLVTDVSGAVVPGVPVRAVNLETNVGAGAVSNENGNYEIPFLLPGRYKVQVEQAGFKSYTRSNLELRIRERLQIDIQLEIGNVTEVVDVTAEAPVLESLTSTVGQTITSRQTTDLPLRGGSLAWLYQQTPGVVLPGLAAGGPWNVDQSSELSAGDGNSRSFDFNVDGVSNNAYGNRNAFVPPPDMVQEVRVEIASYDAAIGHTTGGSINVSLKSGTNALHGSLGSWLSTNPLISRNFYVNKFIFDPKTGPVTPEKIKSNTPVDRWWRHVVSVGGPVYIPGVYDGRNKTFWQFGYQGHERSQPVSSLVSVPTDAQRQGDFSSLLAIGSSYQIYDPHTTRAEGNRFRRDPLPGNIIPASRIDPMAKKLVDYYPRANAPGTIDHLNNYAVTPPKVQSMKQPVARIDHNFSEKHRIYGRYSHSDFAGSFDKFDPNSNVRGRTRARPHRGVALDNVFVLSPQMVLDVRYGFSWFKEYQGFDNQGFDLRELGMSDSLISNLDAGGVTFPNIVTQGLLALGNDGGFNRVNYTHSLMGVLNWVKGNHSLKIGTDNRLMFENNKTYGNVSPRMEFTPTYTRGPLDNSPVAPAGQGLASLLFNIPSAGRIDMNDSHAQSSPFYGIYIQDDWRASRKLTLNLGMRWEYEGPITERYNRSTRDFDFSVANPIQARARAQYSQNPIPELAASAFQTLGGVTFVGVGGNPRGVRDPYKRAFMPRIGLAYQLTPNTVLRAGYGIFYGLLGADFEQVSQPGFNQVSNIVASLDNGRSYVASISNPFPFGVALPNGAAGGLETFLGRAPGFFAADGRRPYTQRWSANIQFQPFSRSVIEIGYMGTKSVRLRASTPFNPTPAQYLSTSTERDQATINNLTATVRNPFIGIDGFAGSSFFNAQNTTRQQLLRPYPHFAGGLAADLPAGSSWYNALTARFDRRFANGLIFHANYTWSKTMEAVSYLNDIDSIPHHVVSNLDRPHRVVVSGIYELPFGRGKRWGSASHSVVNHVIGGWQVNAIYTGQSGPPVDWGNVLYRGEFADIRRSPGDRTLDQWFNTSGFDRIPANQLEGNIRYFPQRISGVRGDGINLWDLGAFKNFQLKEGMRLQLRAEAEGALNHSNFNPPNVNAVNTLFGTVTATQGGEGARRIFIGLKLLF